MSYNNYYNCYHNDDSLQWIQWKMEIAPKLRNIQAINTVCIVNISLKSAQVNNILL